MELFRDTSFGATVRYITKNRVFQYPEERADFVLPNGYNNTIKKSLSGETLLVDSTSTLGEKELDGQPSASPRLAATKHDNEEASSNNELPAFSQLSTTKTHHDGDLSDASAANRSLSRAVSRPNMNRVSTMADIEQVYQDAIRQETIKQQPSRPIVPEVTSNGQILVDWYTTDDPENPQNWPSTKKSITTIQIYFYTLAVYIGSAIFTPSIPYVIEQFHVSSNVASLGLSMYVLGYGVGPLLFSPLSEIPNIGRNPPYIVTFGIFVALSIGTAFANNFPALIVLRFLQGFFGSPVLATAGASLGDIFSLMHYPYALTGMAASATAGPGFGPLISGFSVPKTNWHWSLYEIIFLAGPVFVVLFFCLPETSAQTILLRRAARLRKMTGNSNYISQAEIDQSKMSVSEIIVGNLWRPLQINLLDPAIGFTSLYIGLVYGIFYSFFEAFPLVYGTGIADSITKGYGMNAGEQGLIFLAIPVGVVVSVAIYTAYLYFYFDPRVRKNGFGVAERRLIPGVFASLVAPAGLFLFAWTGFNSPSIHWMVPTIGVFLFVVSVFIIFQVVFIYIPLSYPQYAASLFAGNDFVRSAIAAGAIHFSTPLLHNLGIGRGVSLLGGLMFGGVLGIVFLYYRGGWLRSRSRFAAK